MVDPLHDSYKIYRVYASPQHRYICQIWVLLLINDKTINNLPRWGHFQPKSSIIIMQSLVEIERRTSA